MTDEMRDHNDGAFSEHEKTYIRTELRDFMRKNPARAPFHLRLFDIIQRGVFSPGLQLASGSLALVLVAGTGTAFAAQGALPGSALYGVKVNIEEPLQGAFATSPVAKANWNTQLAARRLSEAVQLAAQNQLTPQAAATVASGLNTATENFDANVAQIATSTNNAMTVATLASNMQATLAANTQVMTEISTAVPDVAEVLAPIVSNAQERSIALNNARTQFDAAVQSDGDQGQIQAAVRAQLEDTRRQINDVAQTLPSSASTTAYWHAKQAQEEMQSGQQNLDQGNYAAALESLQAASVEARAAQLNVSIGAQLANAAGIRLPDASSSDSFSTTSATSSVDANATTTSSSTPIATSTPPAATSTQRSHHRGRHD